MINIKVYFYLIIAPGTNIEISQCQPTNNQKPYLDNKHRHEQKVAQNFYKRKQNANINLYTSN